MGPKYSALTLFRPRRAGMMTSTPFFQFVERYYSSFS